MTVEDAAQRMSLTEDRVRQLARQRVLRSRIWCGLLFVEPAITNYS
ncbi:hypothetical protein [Mycobacterium sp. ST-F2]|nr:hypothetical protein [Mycobacterium sp. ST-F2]